VEIASLFAKGPSPFQTWPFLEMSLPCSCWWKIDIRIYNTYLINSYVPIDFSSVRHIYGLVILITDSMWQVQITLTGFLLNRLIPWRVRPSTTPFARRTPLLSKGGCSETFVSLHPHVVSCDYGFPSFVSLNFLRANDTGIWYRLNKSNKNLTSLLEIVSL